MIQVDQSTYKRSRNLARNWAGCYRVDADEILSEFFVEFLSSSALPLEVFEIVECFQNRMCRASENFARRERRRLQRSGGTLPDAATCVRVPRHDEHGDLNIRKLRTMAMAVCRDDPDRAVVAVMLDEHPDSSTKADVFRQFGLSGTQAYRRSEMLEASLRTIRKPLWT